MTVGDATEWAGSSRRQTRAKVVARPVAGSTLLQRIEHDLPNLSPQFLKVATHLVRERGIPHRQRIIDLATRSGTAPVTIVRLAKRYGFKGFCELKFALLEEADALGPPAGCGDMRPWRSDSGMVHQALAGALETISAIGSIVANPGFMQAARWLHEADTVWINAVMPADALLVDCLTQSLQRDGVRVRPGRMTQMAAHEWALSDKSVQLHVALASAPPGTGDLRSTEVGQACRQIVLARASQSGLACSERCVAVGLDPASRPRTCKSSSACSQH
jgi:hypothetical protein